MITKVKRERKKDFLDKMEKIFEGYVNKHETSLVKCPKCESINVVIKTNKGYFFIVKCNNCGYIKGQGGE